MESDARRPFDDTDIDKYRPMVAEEQLTYAIGRANRVPMPMVYVDSVVHRLARKHKVKVRTLPMVERKIKVEGARATLKAARQVGFAEGECFGRNLARMERLIAEGRMKFDIAPVNAWAQGDLEALRPLLSVVDEDPREDCETAALEAVMSRPAEEVPEALRTGFSILKKQAELQVEAEAEAERNWVNAMDAALARNDSTVAVIPIWLAWNPTVYLGRLRAKGYAVEEPR